MDKPVRKSWKLTAYWKLNSRAGRLKCRSRSCRWLPAHSQPVNVIVKQLALIYCILSLTQKDGRSGELPLVLSASISEELSVLTWSNTHRRLQSQGYFYFMNPASCWRRRADGLMTSLFSSDCVLFSFSSGFCRSNFLKVRVSPTVTEKEHKVHEQISYIMSEGEWFSFALRLFWHSEVIFQDAPAVKITPHDLFLGLQ